MESEWIDINKKLPKGIGDVVYVKLANGNTKKAYYHADGMHWLRSYTNKKTSCFQCHETKDFLHDCTHWMPLKNT